MIDKPERSSEQPVLRHEYDRVVDEIEKIEQHQRKMAEIQIQHASMMERISTMVAHLEAFTAKNDDAHEKIFAALWSQDASSPGVLLRQDRIERQIRTGLRIVTWTVSGGFIGVLGTLVLLFKIAQLLAEAV